MPENNSLGASAKADQALAVPVEPQEGLAPSGFDPSRCAILGRSISDKRATSVTYCRTFDHLDELLEAVTPYKTPTEFTVVPRDFVETGKGWFERTIGNAADLPWVSRAQLAIAMETRRAETGNTDSVAKP